MIMVRAILLMVVFSSLAFLYSCSSDQIEEVDCDISGPSLEVSEVIDAECQPTGKVTVTASGGSGVLLYSIDGINFQPEATFSNLSSNSYTITVVDANGCTNTTEAAVGNSGSDLNFTAETTTGGCGTGTGSIMVNATGGIGGYTYRLGTGVFVDTNTFENVSGGLYTITIKDEEGCITSKQVQVLSGVSFTDDIKPIIDTNCSVISCHGSDSSLPKWETYADIKGSASKIRSTTQNGTMPPEDKLTQSQIDKIACWVDDGAPNN